VRHCLNEAFTTASHTYLPIGTRRARALWVDCHQSLAMALLGICNSLTARIEDTAHGLIIATLLGRAEQMTWRYCQPIHACQIRWVRTA